MATSNINISTWKGTQTPPTIYHKWEKWDEEGNYLGTFTYVNGEWIADLSGVNNEIDQVVEDINNTIEETKQELQQNIDNLENKHDSDITNITNEFNQKIEGVKTDHAQDVSDLETKIQAEVDRATEAESTLNQSIINETSRATAAEQALDLKIDAETLRAQKAEQQLQENINSVSGNISDHINNKENPHEVTKDQVGLGNVTNDAQVRRDEMGQPNGVATLDNNGKIPSSQLNGQLAHVFGVDGVATSTTLPSEGVQTGDIYYTTDNKMFYNYNGTTWDEPMAPKDDTIYNFRNCDKAGDISRTNILYRWDGKDLVEISESLALGETVGTAYEGSKGKENRDAIVSLPSSLVSNIVNITPSASNVVVGFTIANKTGLNYEIPVDSQVTISSASSELAGVITAANYELLTETIPGQIEEIKNYTVNNKPISSNPVINGGDILLNNYVLGESTEQVIPSDTLNTALGKLQLQINSNKSSGDQALATHIADNTNPHRVTKDQVGLGNADNTSDLDKPISTATQAALDTKQPNLVSGENIKTVNDISIVGSGDIDFKTLNNEELTGTGNIDIKTINGTSIFGQGDIDFKTLEGQELTGTGNIDVKQIVDVNGVSQSIFGADPIVTLQDAADAKIYGRSNGSWIDLTPYLTWYVE